MEKTYRFKGALQRFPGKGGIYYILFPYSVEKEFGVKIAVRVKGTLNNIPIDRALKPMGDGTHYIIVNTELRRQAGIRLGNEVTITLKRNQEPDELVIPEELQEVLDMEPRARETFGLQLPSTQRGMAYWISSAKRPETRAQRAAELLRRLTSKEFMFGGKPGKT